MTKRILHRIRLDKIAAVDQPCQQHATVAIIKRAPKQVDLQKVTFNEALEGQMVSQRVSDAFYRAFDSLWARNDAFRTSLTDELAEGGEGDVASEAYLASVRGLVEGAVNAARAAGNAASDEAIEKAIEQVLVAKLSPEGEAPMNITTKAALKGAIAKFDPATSPAAHIDIIKSAAATLNAEDDLPGDGPLAVAKADPSIAKMQRELAILKLSPDAKAHFDGLDEAGQTAFIGKSADAQADDIAKANAADPVLYTTRDGTQITKSAGAVVLALAKSNDDLAKRLEEANGRTQTESFEKRAATQYPNIAKATVVTMLKSAETVGADTDAGKGILASLDTMNKANAGAFQRVGTSDGVEPLVGSMAKARQTFASKVEAIAKRDSISKAAAMEVAEVEEPALFAEAYPPAVPAEVGTAD